MSKAGHCMTARFKVVLLPLLLLGAQTAGQDSEPRKVFLRTCRLGGAVQPCDKFQLKVRAEHRVVEVRQFAHNHGRGGFLIPDEFKSAKRLDLIVETPNGGFELDQLVSCPNGSCHKLKACAAVVRCA